MKAKTETQNSTMDTIKLALAVLLLAGGMVGFYLLDAQPLWVRLLSLLVVVAVAVLVASQTAIGRRILGFLTATRTEVRKVVWPSRQETVQTTLVIIVVVFLMSLFLWGVDSLLFVLVRAVTG